MTNVDMEGIEDVVTCMLSINFVPASVLFDCDASYFFIYKKFTKLFDMILEWLDSPYYVFAPSDWILISHSRCNGYKIAINGKKFSTNLVQFSMSYFDMIFAMIG